jgi:hypothetical protein
LQAEIQKTKESLLKAHAELDSLKQDLAAEKMERASAQADLDATKNKKPDTTEVDGLRKELQGLKDQHQAALMTAQQESAKATKEHLAMKAALEKTLNELEDQKIEAEKNVETAKNDYEDLNTVMTEEVEDARKKASEVEARLKEYEALLKVKDAELAEAKVCNTSYTMITVYVINLLLKTKIGSLASPKSPAKASQGLRASKFAEEDVDSTTTDVKSEAVEGENDSSSAALASVRPPFPCAQFCFPIIYHRFLKSWNRCEIAVVLRCPFAVGQS